MGALLVTTAMIVVSAAPGSAESLVISPLKVETDAIAGGVFDGVIHASIIDPLNPEKGSRGVSVRRAHLQMLIRDWDMAADGTMSYSSPGSTAGSCASWITLSAQSLDIADGGSTDIAYHVRIPRDTPDGVYRAVVFCKTSLKMARGRGDSSDSAAVGAILYLTVGPHLKRACISGFTTSSTGADIVIRNEADGLLRITGTLDVEDAAGKKLLEIPAPAAVVLPGAGRLRDLRVPFPPGFHLAGGQYRVTAILDYGAAALMGARATLTIPSG